MKERVMIAMGLAGQPSFVIADELMITHDLEVVRHMSDRIAVMEKGRIIECIKDIC
jgi:ABC-type dipeptide/oligopeptide/nickel transport system ATPase component